jgi:hypothetical protein
MTDSLATPAEALGPADPPANPFVGPRPFREGELFFGRERETKGLLNMLMSGRIGLLHSPSGAGKTSLIQARLIPEMASRGFQICASADPKFSAIRVGNPPPGDFCGNRYVHSAVSCIYGQLVDDPVELSEWTIHDTLLRLSDRHEGDPQQFLVFDQFEEILTVDPTDQDGQREFFRQLGESLEHSHRWALFAMREDFIGGLDRFLRYVPGQLRSTYRLDLLDAEAALRAAREPAARRGVEFKANAAAELVRDLRTVRVDSPRGGSDEHEGNFVEPVLLQVVCDNLWRKLSQDQGEAFTEISLSDVAAFQPLETAIARYYRRTLRKATHKDPQAERILRDWVEEKLLTPQLLRGQTTTKPRVTDPDDALRVMQERYLVRVDPRPNGVWYELSHDRLIDAIVDDNQSWRERSLSAWQLAAYRWHREGNDNLLLLSATELRSARLSMRGLQLTDFERAFLDLSAKRVADAGKLASLRAQAIRVSLLLAGSLLLNLVLILLLVLR